uniref:EOG090X0GLS n=1 Tax=Eubosmina coregoni TaxID=186181 RepID=A0A4Y7LLS5_9CRUS|nr:EOG090X0GLS [Eubosmina coregoni]SVE70137.1 EOG090X0GLS [Eubosmina coregoni]
MSDNFRAKDIALKAQKKILSKMSTKSVVKVFVDDTTSKLLDNVYRLIKTYTQNKKEAEKIVKNIIKIVTKISLLAKNDQFSKDELALATDFQIKFHKAAKTVISFYEVDFSYDQKFLTQLLSECRNLLKQIVQPHLTDKSIGRVDMVFNFFSNPSFLDIIFKKNSEYSEIMTNIIKDMHSALEGGEL